MKFFVTRAESAAIGGGQRRSGGVASAVIAAVNSARPWVSVRQLGETRTRTAQLDEILAELAAEATPPDLR